MANYDLSPWNRDRRFAVEPFSSFRKQIDRLFDDFTGPYAEGSHRPAAAKSSARPCVEVHDTGSAYEVNAELPGMEQKDVQLEIRDNILIISGEKRIERKSEGAGPSWSEREFGHFQRALPLEAEVDADKAEAHFKNGVLTVTLPKNPKAQDKIHRIDIH